MDGWHHEDADVLPRRAAAGGQARAAAGVQRSHHADQGYRAGLHRRRG